MIEYKFVRFFSSRQIGCVTNGGYPIPFRSVLYGLYRGWVIVPIDICYNRDGPRLVATPMIRQGDSLRPHIKIAASYPKYRPPYRRDPIRGNPPGDQGPRQSDVPWVW